MRVLRSALALGLFAVVARPAYSQDRYATAEVRGGFSMTTGATKVALKGQSSFGAGFALAIGKRLHLGVTVDWAHHSLEYVDANNDGIADGIINGTVPTNLPGCQATDAHCVVIGGISDRQYNILHTFLKVSYSLVSTDKVSFDLNAGPGFMIFSPNTNLSDATGTVSDLHLALNAGASATYWFTDRMGVMISPQMDMALKRTMGKVFTDKSAMIFPITGGFRFKL